MQDNQSWHTFRRIIAFYLVSSTMAFSASDTWNQPGGTHQWTDPANWLSGVQYPDGGGDVASFTNDITSAQTVSLTQAVTVGTINLGDSAATVFGYTIGAATQTNFLDNGASVNVINNLAGTNIILSRLVATGVNQDLTVNISAVSRLTIGTTGTQSPMSIGTFTKLGDGELDLGTQGSTFADPNVYLLGSGRISIFGNDTFPTNSILHLGAGAFVLGGGGRQQSVAEIRGIGIFSGPGNSYFVVGDPASAPSTGVTISDGGRLRPGDTNAIGQIGTLFIGAPSSPAPTPSFQSGSETYLDIASYTSFDKVDIRRTVTTINGGDIYINFLGGFIPTNETQFRLIVNTSTKGMIDGNGGDLFDNIYAVNFGNATNLWRAEIGDAVLASEDPGGLDGRNVIFTYIPEPGATALFLAASALWLRSRRSWTSLHS